MRIILRRQFLVQIICLAVFFTLTFLTRYPLHLKEWSSLFFYFDPFLGITTFLSTRTLIFGFLPALLLFLLTFFFGRFFCWYICPLGTCMDALARLTFQRRWGQKLKMKSLFFIQISLLIILLIFSVFKLNGVAQLFDPLVISLGAVISLPGLILFLFIIVLSTVLVRFWCFNACPLGAILELTGRLGKRMKKRSLDIDLSRRRFLASVFSGILTVAALKIGLRNPPANERLLRPPGARKEPAFNSLCVRCGECVKVCPTGGLKPCFLEAGLEGLGTPRLVPRIGSCELCFLCGQVCPSSAITRTELGKFKIGTARIDPSRCIAWNQGKLCLICKEYCPVVAIEADEKLRPYVSDDKCVGCGACEKNCPVSGEAAVVVFRKGEIRG